MTDSYFALLPPVLAFELPERYRPVAYGLFTLWGVWLIINARREGSGIKRARAPESDPYPARSYIFWVRLVGMWFFVCGGLMLMRHYNLFPQYRWLTEWLR